MDLDLTAGHLLGGAIRYSQPISGYRTGIEPVFLAAAVPARAGERILEAGTGAGAGLLCLSHRVPGVVGLGVEIEPAMARIAEANVIANEMVGIVIRRADLLTLEAGLPGGTFDHAMANPPWHDSGGTAPDGPLRHRAKMAGLGLTAAWIIAMARLLRGRGTLTCVLPPRLVPEALAALAAAGCGSGLLFPLWPRLGREPRMLLIQAIKNGRGDFRLLPGLILHENKGYTDAAQAILRRGEALPLA